MRSWAPGPAGRRVNERGSLRVALPGLVAAVSACTGHEALPRLPAAEWLLARADRTPARSAEWRAWLLEAVGAGTGVLQRFPAGPCTGLAWSGRVPEGTWACAAPVHLLAGLDHLQLATPVPLPVTSDEEAALLATLNDHVEGTGFRLRACDGRGWLLACPAGLECTASEPAAAIGCNLRERLPGGREAARVRAMVNDWQMLLHEHPVNVARESRGLPTVNSVWPWGFGAATAPTGTVRGLLITDDAWLTGLWRLHGGEVRPLATLGPSLEAGTGRILVGIAPRLDGMDADAELHWLERAVFGPLQSALRAGRLERVELLVGDAVFALRATGRLRFWRRTRPLGQLLP